MGRWWWLAVKRGTHTQRSMRSIASGLSRIANGGYDGIRQALAHGLVSDPTLETFDDAGGWNRVEFEQRFARAIDRPHHLAVVSRRVREGSGRTVFRRIDRIQNVEHSMCIERCRIDPLVAIDKYDEVILAERSLRRRVLANNHKIFFGKIPSSASRGFEPDDAACDSEVVSRCRVCHSVPNFCVLNRLRRPVNSVRPLYGASRVPVVVEIVAG